MKKESLSFLKKKAWALFSEYTRRRYADPQGMVRCVTCRENSPKVHWKTLQAGHFIAGRYNSILFHEKGVHPQCYSCNVCKHGNSMEYFLFMERTYGREVIDEIHRLSKMSVPFYPYQMKELIDELRDKISKLPATQLQGS